MKKTLFARIKKKADKINCNVRVVAVGFNSKNELLGMACNIPSWVRRRRNTHAEAILINRYGRQLSKIVIARFGKSGNHLVVNPCAMCQAYADSFGIKIESINPDKEN